MIRLQAKTSSDASTFILDIDEGARVTLNLSTTAPPDIFVRRAGYSSAFTLPMTENNNRFFEHYYDVNAEVGSFDPRAAQPCEVYVDSSLVFEGILRLINLSLTNKTYQVNVNSLEGDFFIELSTQKLADLFDLVSDYDYYPTSENFKSSQEGNDITLGSVGSNNLAIPLADYGRSNDTGRMTFDAANESGIAGQNSIQATDFKPAIRVRHLLQLIADAQGVEFDYGTLDSDTRFTRMWMLLATEVENLPVRPWTGFRVGISDDVNWPTTSGYVPVHFDVDSGGDFYDPEDMWVTLNPSYFTAPASGNFNFSGRLLLDNQGQYNNLYQSYEVVITANGVVVSTANIGVPPPNIVNTLDQGFYALSAWNVPMNQGDLLAIAVRRISGTGPGPVLTPSYDGDETYFTLVSVNSTTTLSPVSIKGCMPDLTQADFVKNIMMRFNRTIEKGLDGTINFVPTPTVSQSSDTDDWTEKIDTVSQILVDPPSNYTSRFLRFGDKQNDTWGSTYSRNQLGVDLGSFVLDNNDAFTTDEKAFESVFGAYQISPIPSFDSFSGADLVRFHPIPQLWKDNQDGTVSATTFPPLLMYLNPTITTFPTDYFIGSLGIDKARQFGPYLNFQPSEDGQAIWWQPTWNVETAQGDTGFPPGFVERYWNDTVQEMYNKNGRKITASFLLRDQDVSNFDFSRAIRIANGLYRVLSIDGYQVGENQLTQVQLLSLPERVASGVLYPSGDNDCLAADAFEIPDGTVNFTNASGGTTATTEACCNQFGYSWDAVEEECYWNAQRQAKAGGRGSQVVPVGAPVRFDDPFVARFYRNVNTFNSGRFPIVQQGFSYEMLDRSRRVQSAVNRMTLTCTTVGSFIETASVQGEESPGIIMPTDTICRMMIYAIGVDISGRNPVGTTTYIQQYAVAKNVQGTVTVLASTELEQVADTVATNRSVGVIAGTKQGETVTMNALAVRCQGQNDCTVNWTLDVQLTWLDFQAFNLGDPLLLFEDSLPQETEDNALLSQEE